MQEVPTVEDSIFLCGEVSHTGDDSIFASPHYKIFLKKYLHVPAMSP